MTEALDFFGQRFFPVVESEAKPETDVLLRARSVLQQNPELHRLFNQFRTESRSVSWLRALLTLEVGVRAEEFTLEQVKQACHYLADEYAQLGDGYLVVARDTGKVAMVLREQDLYNPGLLGRESGERAQALSRINPMLEAALVTSYHDDGRETQVLALLTARAHQTDLLREEGDLRLRLATRKGRRSLAREFSENEPAELLRRAGGTTGMFLRHFELTDEYDGPLPCLEGVARCRSRLGVQDMATLNLNYDRLGVLRASAPQAWVRDIALQLSMHARDAQPEAVPVGMGALSAELLGSQQLWILDPDVFSFVQRAHGQAVPAMPVEGAASVGLSGHLGYLVVPSDFEVESRELADQWDVTASLAYRLYVDLQSVRFVPLLDVARSACVEARRR